MEISKREARTILSALSAGVTPRSGLRHIAVGRLKEVTALKQDLEQIAAGGAAVRFVVGRYGSGKSFLLQLVRAHALESRFVVADADFSPERRLYGSGDEGLATYRELMRNLSTLTRPDGNALPTLIEKWISSLQSAVMAEGRYAAGTAEFVQAVNAAIYHTLNEMEELVHGFDFGRVIGAYYQGYLEGNDGLKSDAIRWLRGEFNSRSEAHAALGVRSIIDSDSYYDYLKVLARFVQSMGYAGLLVCLDEAAYLYKISNSVSRKNNYEAILTIVNDCLQGKAGAIGFVFGGTPEFMEDPRRGLFSYEALRSRLSANRFAASGLQDFASPVLSLASLTNEEVFVLLQKIRTIYNSTLPAPLAMDDTALTAFMEQSLQRMGAREFSTPRELVRDYVSLLNLMAQYPGQSWETIAGRMPRAEAQPEPGGGEADPLERFKDFKVGG